MRLIINTDNKITALVTSLSDGADYQLYEAEQLGIDNMCLVIRDSA